jgi:hypothetical protein
MARQTSLTPAPITAIHEPVSFSADVLGVRPEFDIDPIELLLVSCADSGPADKLRMLRQRTADAFALMVSSSEIQDLSTKLQLAEQRLKRMLDHAHDDGFKLKEDDPRVIAPKKQVAKLTDDLSRLKQRAEQRAAEWRICSRLLAATETLLKTGRPGNCVLEAVEIEPVKLLKGEGTLDGIERLRRFGRERKAEIHTIQSSPYPRSHCKSRVREQIELVAPRCPDVTLIVEHDGEIIWPMMRVRSQVFNAQPGAVAFAEVPDTLGLFVWLHRDALLAKLDAEIDTEGDDRVALSHEQRQQREAEVQGDLLEIERQEATLTWLAMAQNLPVEHRIDINPLALLGLKLVTTPRAIPSPGSSPEHAMTSIGGLPW